jgi:asparagine synthase (glutamine-hydrolysing)
MCGVAGILSLNGRPIGNVEARIEKMTGLLHHRGPDARGCEVLDGGLLALGNTRLAITGPKDEIELPTRSRDRNSVITFNGEIYNFLEIRKNMESKGVRFRSDTDTEVLVEGLRRRGEDFLSELDGMWAFACYDVEKRELLLSRDLMGERHLYYRILNDELVFSSEVLPIIADSKQVNEFDFAAVVCAFRYSSPPSGHSIVKGVKRLHPGHNLIVRADGKITERRYRRLHPEKWQDFHNNNPSEDEVVDQFDEIMEGRSKLRVPPHVPFVSTLSGGLDSALVVAYASSYGKRKIDTVFAQSAATPGKNPGEELDEFETSKITSARLGTEHIHTIINNEGCVPILKEIADNAFEGMLDSGVASFEMLGRRIREFDRKVMLISDGPDELLGGYGVDRRAYQIDMMRRFNPVKYSALKAVSWKYRGRRTMSQIGYGASVIPPGYGVSPFHFDPQHQTNGPDILKRVFETSLVDDAANNYGVVDPIYDDVVSELGYDETQQRALGYASSSLPDMFNLRTDKAFMHTSVESRLPFQTVDAVEFMIALPAEMRFGKGDTTKKLLRSSVNRHIGPEVAYRSKHGFASQLYDTPDVWKAMNFEETIMESSMFSELPFKRGTREKVLTQPFNKFVWPMFVLARLHQQMKSGDFTSRPVSSPSR